MYICICNDVTESELSNAVKNKEPLPTGNKCCLYCVMKFLKALDDENANEYLKELEDGLNIF